MVRKNLIRFTLGTIISGLSLSGCGGDHDLTTVTPASYQAAVATNQQPQCCCTCTQPTDTQKAPVEKKEPVKKKTSTKTEKKDTEKPKTATETKDTKTTTDSKTTADANDPKVKGRKILDKIMSNINQAKAFEVEVVKNEKNLATGELVTNGIKLWARQPDQVKLELTYHSKNANTIGTKITYNSNSTKVKVRPSGVLSLVSAELDMTDDRITSGNKYTPAATDIFGLAKRLTQPSYDAELVGKTTVDGKEVYVLKIYTKETNALDSRIKYEKIGFEPSTFKVKLWEAYDGSGDEPYVRMVMKTFSFLDSMSDDKMKL